jgi:DNA repair exonuclease SbcCD ATPase subunit
MRYLHPNLEAKVQAVGKLAASCDNSGPLEIECGPAFTVICGRNGTGKSSICDSLEFVLTGTLERYQEESERGEKISDYLWWRGKPAVPNHSVVVEFEEEDGSMFKLGRVEDSDATPKEIDRLAYRKGVVSDVLEKPRVIFG